MKCNTLRTVRNPDLSAESAIELDWEVLPAGLRDLKDVLGPGAALAICAEWGGRTLYVPSSAPAGHPLNRLLGPETADRLCRAMAGDRLAVPKADAVLRQIRSRKIRKRRRDGESVASLAEEFGLTRRRILQILDEEKAA
jgi:Mor family transcriptional regulator